MRFRPRPFAWIGLTLLSCLVPAVHLCQAQEIRIEGLFPRQLARGETTLINVAIPSRDAIQSVEISPSAGIKVADIKPGPNFQGALTWSELRIEVAADAPTGDRTLAILLPIGRTTPVTITVPSHVPKISELRLLSVQSNPPTLDLQFLASDPSADLGASPYVWFMMGCGRELVPGIVHGKGNSVVRASIPGPASGRCDLQVRVIDGLGIESNTLRTTVEFKN